MSLARGSVATLLVIVACLVLPAALLANWMGGVVTDTDDYVRTVAPLAEDPVVQRAAEQRLQTAAAEAVQRATGGSLPPGGRVLTAKAAEQVVRSPAFGVVWRAANRSAHQQAVAVLEGTDGEDGRVSIELDALVRPVLAVVARQGLVPGDRLPQAGAGFSVIDEDQLRRARGAYALLADAGLWLPLGWIVLVVSALVVAPRRLRVLTRLGFGSFAALALLLGGLFAARQLVVDGSGSSLDADLLAAVWDVVVGGLLGTIRVGLVASALVLAASLLGRLAGGRQHA